MKVTLKVTRRETAHAPSLNQGEKINVLKEADGAFLFRPGVLLRKRRGRAIALGEGR